VEELLQLHIVIRGQPDDDTSLSFSSDSTKATSPDIDEWYDDLHDLLWSEGFVVVNRDAPSFDDLGMSVSTVLFERRADNMAQIEDIHAETETWPPISTVFRHEYEQTFGEYRSPADPDTHIMLLATNWGVTQPSVRWTQHLDTLEGPPLLRDDCVYQANTSGMYALDAESGEELWKSPSRTIQIPVGNDALIFGCEGTAVVALDATTGDVEWRTEFDELGDHMIDSRVAIWTDNVYVGLRNGNVRSLSQADGTWSDFYSFTETPVRLAAVPDGLVVNTDGNKIHLLNWTGGHEWTKECNPSQSISDAYRGMLYGGSSEGVSAVSAATGTTEWITELSRVSDVTVSQESLLVTTKTSLHGLDLETGTQIWEYTPPEMESISGIARLDDAIACTGARKVSLDKQIRQYDEQLLHVFKPTTENPILTYDLGIGDCYGLAANNDTLICAMDGKLLCFDDFPIS
jgi:outer membrane protein assembly factor BamB